MAKFLSKFTRPKIWEGYPYLLSAAVGDVEDNLILTLKGYNVAGALLATNQSTSEAFTNSVVHWNVSQVYGTFEATIKTITAYVETVPGEVITDTLTFDVILDDDICSNPIMLLGRNSLGGSHQWMFDFSQEYTFDYGNNIKAKRLGLNAANLTLNEWEALQDFITLGTEYRVNITEFTSSTIKTSARIGQQLYDVDEDGNKIGVTSVSVKNKTLTQQVKHRFEMTIEYPEIFVA